MKTPVRFLLAALLCAAACAAADAAPISVIANGAVQVRTGATGEWQALGADHLVVPGQSVRTDSASTAELRFADGSRVQLAPDTVFAVEQTDAQESRFSLSFGKIRAAFAGLLSSRISIRTPTAVCAVRGTVFEIGADDKNTDVTMAEGVLEVNDGKGGEAVLTSEETLNIGQNGMGQPHMVALGGEHALGAVRPYAVHQEMARESARTHLEDARNRELKAAQAQLGEDAVDAFGRRVRIEEYLLRPTPESFEVLTMDQRSGSFNWGTLTDTFHAPIGDLSQVASIINDTYFSKTMPANWLTDSRFFATNTVDSINENVAIGNPIAINFSGYGSNFGTLYYPQSIDFTQTFTSPGLIGALGATGDTRQQFDQHQDFGQTNAGLFTFTQSVPNSVTGLPSVMYSATVNPTSAVSIANPTVLAGTGPGSTNYDLTNTVQTTPNGPGKADILSTTQYPDQSIVSVQSMLVGSNGQLLDASGGGDYSKSGSYNVEYAITTNFFQGRSIDILIDPQILAQTGRASQTSSNPQP